MTLKKIFAVFALSALFALPMLCVRAEALPRLAVRAFDDKSQDGDAPAAAITDMMITELDKAGIFMLVEREHLDYIAEEIKLGQSGLMDMDTAPEVGKLKGAQYSMTGAITLYYYNDKQQGGIALPQVGAIFGTAQALTAYVDIDIRIIDNETGATVYADAKRGMAKQNSREPGLLNSGHNRTFGGILSLATRDAVKQHVGAIANFSWHE